MTIVLDVPAFDQFISAHSGLVGNNCQFRDAAAKPTSVNRASPTVSVISCGTRRGGVSKTSTRVSQSRTPFSAQPTGPLQRTRRGPANDIIDHGQPCRPWPTLSITTKSVCASTCELLASSLLLQKLMQVLVEHQKYISSSHLISIALVIISVQRVALLTTLCTALRSRSRTLYASLPLRRIQTASKRPIIASFLQRSLTLAKKDTSMTKRLSLTYKQ